MIDDESKYIDAVNKHGSIREAARVLDIPYSTFYGLMKRAALRGKVGGPPIPDIAQPPEGFVISRNAGAYDANGKLIRQWVGSKPDSGDVFIVPAGHTIKGESALVDAEGRVMAKWVKTRESGVSTADLTSVLQSAFEKYDGFAPEIEHPKVANEKLLTVYPIPDLHFGLYSWGVETGTDYDTTIAKAMIKNALSNLVSQSLPSAEAVLLVLGDFWHQNDQTNETPMSRHQLDVDGRWAKVYDDGLLLLVELIRMIANKHPKVTVRILPGNHDEGAAVTVASALAMLFSKTKHIEVSKCPKTIWYYEFGRNLMGAHHGHKQKFETMAQAMVCDMREAWGRTYFHSFYSGHIHHITSKEIMGIVVESFSSPSAPDSYNSSHGYRARRSLTAITHHSDDGEIGRHKVNIGFGKCDVV